MAYIIGILDDEEEAELKRRGWDVEDAPTVDYDNKGGSALRSGMKMVWVDQTMFNIMSGPDWEKGN